MTLILVLTTAALVFVTWKYVAHTQRMADVMVKDYEVRITPLIYEELKVSSEPLRIPDVITLKNIGFNKVFLKNVRKDIISKTGAFENINLYYGSELYEVAPGSHASYNLDFDSKAIPSGSQPELIFSYDYAGIDQNFRTKKIKVR